MNGTVFRRPIPAPFALPAASTALLVLGAVVSGLDGRIGPHPLLAACAVVVAVTAATAEPVACIPTAVIAWLTAVAFSGPPYADLHLSGSFPMLAAEVLSATALVASVVTAATRVVSGHRGTSATGRATIRNVGSRSQFAMTPGRGLFKAIGRRRQLAGLGLTVALMPVITVVLAAARPHLSLADDLLIYLVALVAITVVGGFWPAVVAAIASSLLLNWYFTPPLHTWSIEQPQNLLALLLFVTVALLVGTVVHLSARRADEAARASGEAASLLELARTVLAGEDTPVAVLAHLRDRWGVTGELQERTGERWTTVAASGTAEPDAEESVVPVSDTMRLVLHGHVPASGRLVDGFAAQAVAALDRDRLRTQAAQAEALAEGNRMRTALLAAVSHDLRTPLASIKASVSSLRQSDVTWSAEDEAALLATVEESTDRLDALIGNLLDMSRLQTGSLQPFLRPTAVDEVVPVALHGLDGGDRVRLALPETLPLVATDPGLLERAIANLVANALRYSPPGVPPSVEAFQRGESVVIAVVDHGPGVPVTAHKRMFEPFQRLGDRSVGTGVGLGLAVAKGFVEAMGGSIWPDETPGGGLTVRITLRPAAAEASARTAEVRP